MISAFIFASACLVSYPLLQIARAIDRLAERVHMLNTHGLHLRSVPGCTVDVTVEGPK